MRQVNVHQAKTSLSLLLLKAEAGEDIVIARNGKPSVRLVPVRDASKKRAKFGDMKGKIWFAHDAHLPMPNAEAEQLLNDPLLAPKGPRRRR